MSSSVESDGESSIASKAKNSSKSRKSRVYFSSTETNLLLSLIEEKHNILEDKSTEFLNLEKKRNAWEVLTQNFNSAVDVTQRTCSQLQKKWDNLKSRGKKDV